jgi:hypothetical protein
MSIFHSHRKQRTGRLITAGYRKPNLPPGQYNVMCQGPLFSCECGAFWILTKEFGMVPVEAELYEIEDAA